MEQQKNKAAVALGKRGAGHTSEAKKLSSASNGTLGGRRMAPWALLDPSRGMTPVWSGDAREDAFLWLSGFARIPQQKRRVKTFWLRDPQKETTFVEIVRGPEGCPEWGEITWTKGGDLDETIVLKVTL